MHLQHRARKLSRSAGGSLPPHRDHEESQQQVLPQIIYDSQQTDDLVFHLGYTGEVLLARFRDTETEKFFPGDLFPKDQLETGHFLSEATRLG